MAGSISVSEFINSDNGYRGFWIYSNSNGKNSVDAREQLPEVVRKIIYAAYRLNVKERDEHKTVEVKGECIKYHAHSDSSIEDSIKGVATAYKSQPATRLLEGIGNFGAAAGDEGAAGRYTSVSGTPLLTAIFRDIPFLPFNTDDTGLEQPEYISCPIPMALINGHSPIGTGKSCYLGERDAREVVQWIDELRKADWNSDGIFPPDPTSVTGCKTWLNYDNGYIYYEAVVHEGVNMNDLTKRGRFDVITALPPKSTSASVIANLTKKLPTRATKQIVDGSGKGRPTWIIVPHGYLDAEDYNKYGLRNARKETIYVWDHERRTMRVGTVETIAKEWFEDRCRIVTLRLTAEKGKAEATIHRIDLIKEFAEHHMQDWKSEDVVAHFVNLFPETGEEDASLVLGMPVRNFMPENLGKNELQRVRQQEIIEGLQSEIDHIGDVVIKEALEVIDAQERFFKAG